MVFDYIKAFFVGGLLCVIGQILIDKTSLTPAKILVSYVVAGVILGSIGLTSHLRNGRAQAQLFHSPVLETRLQKVSKRQSKKKDL